jgi:hypothetical protein
MTNETVGIPEKWFGSAKIQHRKPGTYAVCLFCMITCKRRSIAQF